MTMLTALLLLSGNAALADVPDDKSDRLDQYRSRALDLKENKGRHDLKIGDRPIGDAELARLADDRETLADLNGRLILRKAFQLGLGLFGLPFGSYLAYDNLYGKRGKEDYAPKSVLAPYPPGSFGSYFLTLTGGVLVFWGGSLLAQWGGEKLGFSHPNLLNSDETKRLQKAYHRKLRTELALAPEDVASASATASLAEEANAGWGEEGTAAFGLNKAAKTLEAQQGRNFRLFLVLGDLRDSSGKLEAGGWRYYFYHPEKPDLFKVTVSKFGEPEIDATKDFAAYVRRNGQSASLSRHWKIDSPGALQALKAEFNRRGLSDHEEASISLYPYFEDYPRPVWIVEAKKIRLAVDAASGAMVESLNSPLPPEP